MQRIWYDCDKLYHCAFYIMNKARGRFVRVRNKGGEKGATKLPHNVVLERPVSSMVYVLSISIFIVRLVARLR